MSEDILEQIQGALDQTCGNCQRRIPPESPSAYYCDADCQTEYLSNRATRPTDVHWRPNAAAYPPGPMRWRPGLVADDPLPDMTPLEDPPAELRYPRGAADPLAPVLNGVVYRRADRQAYHFRLDDGHRWVGRDVPELEQARTGAEDEARRHWRALERELRNTRHTEPVLRRQRGYTVIDEFAQYAAGGIVTGPTPVSPASHQHVHVDTRVGWLSPEPQPWSTPYGAEVGARQAGRTRAAAEMREWLERVFAQEAARPVVEPPRMGYRPRLRWCVSCGRSHRAPGALEAQVCTCCHRPLPRITYTMSTSITAPGVLHLAVRHDSADLRVGQFVGIDVDVAFGQLEQQLVEDIRRREGMTARCDDLPVRAGNIIAPAGTPLPDMMRALREFMGNALQRVGITQWPAEQPEHPMQAAIRRRRERQGHTGPRQPARAPRRIDPRGGAR